jgi:hypothetical protein
MKQNLRFPDWYYGGPYLRVGNPDADLPRRDPAVPISPERQARTEFDGAIEGERLIAPFRDANTVECVLGALLQASDYPDTWDDESRYVYPTIQGCLAEIDLRLETKLRNKIGRSRAGWLTLALDRVRKAMQLFATRDCESAKQMVRLAYDLVSSGNKVGRRKVSFVVGPDGTAEKV